MKKLMYVCLLFSSAITFSNAQGIQFVETLEEAKAVAKDQNKIIFMDAYASWCGPCKWMSKNVFTKDDVGTYMTKNFVSVKVDMEKGNGPELSKKYKVNAYPTLLYLDANGDLLHKAVGARDANGLMELGDVALDPSKRLASMNQKYDEGKMNAEEKKDYMTLLMQANEPFQDVALDIWDSMSESERLSKEGYDMMENATGMFNKLGTVFFNQFINNKDAYIESVGAERIKDALDNIFYSNAWKVFRAKNDDDKKKYEEAYLAIFPENKKSFGAAVNYYTYRNDENKKVKYKHVNTFMKMCDDSNMLNSAAWDVYENEQDKKYLKMALKWVVTSIDLKAGYANTDTKAALLLKLQRYKECKEECQKAIQLAEEEGYSKDQISGTYELLEAAEKEL